MEERYYHFRDQENRPVITVCLLKIGDQIAKGIAICSDLDNPCKKDGRDRAAKRAIKAIVAEKNSRYMRRKEVLKKWRMYSGDFNTLSKVTYSPILTKFERKLLKKPTQKYEQQSLPFLIEKGMFLYGRDGTLRGETCQVSQTDDKIKTQINTSTEEEKKLIGINIEQHNLNLLNEIRGLRSRLIQLENQNTNE